MLLRVEDSTQNINFIVGASKPVKVKEKGTKEKKELLDVFELKRYISRFRNKQFCGVQLFCKTNRKACIEGKLSLKESYDVCSGALETT